MSWRRREVFLTQRRTEARGTQPRAPVNAPCHACPLEAEEGGPRAGDSVLRPSAREGRHYVSSRCPCWSMAITDLQSYLRGRRQSPGAGTSLQCISAKGVPTHAPTEPQKVSVLPPSVSGSNAGSVLRATLPAPRRPLP